MVQSILFVCMANLFAFINCAYHTETTNHKNAHQKVAFNNCLCYGQNAVCILIGHTKYMTVIIIEIHGQQIHYY